MQYMACYISDWLLLSVCSTLRMDDDVVVQPSRKQRAAAAAAEEAA